MTVDSRVVCWVEQRAMRILKGLVRNLYCDLEMWNMSWILENESIQVSNSFYMNSLKLERSNKMAKVNLWSKEG